MHNAECVATMPVEVLSFGGFQIFGEVKVAKAEMALKLNLSDPRVVAIIVKKPIAVGFVTDQCRRYAIGAGLIGFQTNSDLVPALKDSDRGFPFILNLSVRLECLADAFPFAGQVRHL